MATQTVNAGLVLDALADSIGKTLTNAQKMTFVERVTNTVGGAQTNEEKATLFNELLVKVIRNTSRTHAMQAEQATYQAQLDQVGQDAISDL